MAIILALTAARQRWQRRQLSSCLRCLLRYIPWLLATPYIVFVGCLAFLSFVLGPFLFGSDIIGALYECRFREPETAQGCTVWWLLALWLFRLLPGGVLLVLLVMTWRKAWIGGIAFFAGTTWYLMTPLGRLQQMWMNIVFVGPAVAVSLLFFVRWWLRNYLGTSSHTEM